MKKVIKSRVFLIIVLCIISCGIGVYAAVTYNATDVLYTTSDGTSMTVNDALNDLYANFLYLYKGKAVYYNPVSGKVCTDYVESNSTTGTKTGCMKWYIFQADFDNVTMILDHNTTATLVWNTGDVNVAYESSNIKPEVDKLVSESKWVDTPRLISAEEVVQITGNTSWTNTSDWFYFDSNSLTQTAKSQGASKYAWLFDYTAYCTSYGCNTADNTKYTGGYIYGYWTSTTYGTAGSGSGVWIGDMDGSLGICDAAIPDRGVRPVITIPKSRLS